MDYTSYHVPHIQGCNVSSNTTDMTAMITLFFLILFHSHRCFQTHINFPQDFSDMLLILLPLRIIQNLHYNYHGDCRILVNGMQICYLKCCYHLTSILDRRSRPNYPRYSLRMHLHNFLLDTYQPHTTSSI